jgi:hypothetical protein
MEWSGARASWDFFTAPEGAKNAWIREIGSRHAVLCSTEAIEERRWIRVILHSDDGISRAAYARVTEQQEIIDLWEDETLTLFRHGLEWIRPIEQDWVARLSEREWAHCACSNLIPKESAQALCGLCALKESVF